MTQIAIVVLQLATIAVVLNLLRETRKMANGFADLKQAVVDFAGAVGDFTTTIEAALAVITSGTASGAEAEQASKDIEAGVATMKAETQKVKDILNPSDTGSTGGSASGQ